ncbi:MAG: glycerophosphodiester phosphodiesterase [Telluria sp.]
MWPYPKVLAHRGGGKLAPENTLAGFRCGYAHGFRAVEFDVMLARDSVPVVMHDPYLGRTVAGSGNVYDFDAAELARMDAGSWLNRDFAGEGVPTLVQVVEYCRGHGIWMNIELKPAPGFEAETGEVVGEVASVLFEGESADRLPLFSSFNLDALRAVRCAAPGFPRGLLYRELPPDWQAQAQELGAAAIHCDHTRLTPARAEAVRATGLGLFCYTVNDPARARELLSWGVEAFCTDRIDLIGPDFAT